MGRLLRLPLTVFDCTGVVGHQSLARDHLAYCNLATDRQKKRANGIVLAYYTLTVSRVDRRNSAPTDALRPEAKLVINWTGPYKTLAARPLLRRRDPGRLATREQPSLFGSLF